MDLWLIQLQLTGGSIYAMWDRVLVQPDFQLQNPKSMYSFPGM